LRVTVVQCYGALSKHVRMAYERVLIWVSSCVHFVSYRAYSLASFSIAIIQNDMTSHDVTGENKKRRKSLIKRDSTGFDVTFSLTLTRQKR
jgi:hypothetical protein